MKGTASNEMKVLLEKYNEEIKLLEQQLQDVQKTEMEWRQQAAVSSNPPSTDTEEVRVHSVILRCTITELFQCWRHQDIHRKQKFGSKLNKLVKITRCTSLVMKVDSSKSSNIHPRTKYRRVPNSRSLMGGASIFLNCLSGRSSCHL